LREFEKESVSKRGVIRKKEGKLKGKRSVENMIDIA
jgi:hypothetical protein